MGARTKKVALTGVLGALAVALSFLEGLLPPLPMTPPGYKLGLSNLVSMFAAGALGLPSALFLAVLKGGFAFFTRGLAAGAMSLSGAVLSTLAFWLLWRRTKVSYPLLGVCGALAHNGAQLVCAVLLTSRAALFYTPSLILFAILSGLLTGALLRVVLPPLRQILDGWR